MTTLLVTEDQLSLISRALDLYSRIGIGQLDKLLDHPTFVNERKLYCKDANGNTDWVKNSDLKEETERRLVHARELLLPNDHLPLNASLGIHSPNVDESCRVAFDIHQVIRHEFWKAGPNPSKMQVMSSISFTAKKDSQLIRCKL